MNNHIIAAGLIIVGSGVVQAWTSKKPITPVIIGGYVFMLILSILDMFGGQISTIASALAMLAVVYVLLNVFPWSQISSLLKGGK